MDERWRERKNRKNEMKMHREGGEKGENMRERDTWKQQRQRDSWSKGGKRLMKEEEKRAKKKLFMWPYYFIEFILNEQTAYATKDCTFRS